MCSLSQICMLLCWTWFLQGYSHVYYQTYRHYFSLYSVKYLLYWKILQLKVVNINFICSLCCVYLFLWSVFEKSDKVSFGFLLGLGLFWPVQIKIKFTEQLTVLTPSPSKYQMLRYLISSFRDITYCDG